MLKLKHLPIYLIYFSTALAGATSIAVTQIQRDILNLSAEQYTFLGIFTGLPWTIKMVIGSLSDSVKIFGNNRKSYIIIGQILIALSTTLFIDLASTKYVSSYINPSFAWAFEGFTYSLGAVISDIIADIMAIDLVEDKNTNELESIQVLSRLSLGFGGVIGAFLAWYFTKLGLSIVEVLCFEYILPFIGLFSLFFIPSKSNTSRLQPLNTRLVYGGIVYSIIAILGGTYIGVELTFLVSLLFIGWLGLPLLQKLPNKNMFILLMLGLFLYRSTPGLGEGVVWWVTQGLDLGDGFLARLRIISSCSGFLVLLLVSKLMISQDVFRSLALIGVAGTLLSLPEILVYYNIVGPPEVALMFDTALGAPLGHLSMIPLGIIIARNAPQGELGGYTTITASFLNLASMGGSILTKWLQSTYPVLRNDFSNLGNLMVASAGLGAVMVLSGLVLIYKGSK